MSLRDVELTVKPTATSYYFAEYPLGEGKQTPELEVVRTDLPKGTIAAGSTYKYRGPASVKTTGNTLCLVTKDAGGRVVDRVCDRKNVKKTILSCAYNGSVPPETDGDSGTVPTNVKATPWWVWLIMAILLIMVIVLAVAYARKKPNLPKSGAYIAPR